MAAPPENSWKDSLRAYIIEHGDSLDFTRHFWKGCEPLERDVIGYYRFARAIQSLDRGEEVASIPRKLNVGVNTIPAWSDFTKMPKLAHYLKGLLEFGTPADGQVWLNTDCSHGYAFPIGQFVKVPNRIGGWVDVEAVLSQLQPLSPTPESFSRRYLFGFLLGMMIGDSSKSKQKTAHRHIGLVLSKKYDTNLALGDFTCVCAQDLGLRMHRGSDLAKPEGKPNGFFQWHSQSSPLIDWLFQVGLGLRDGEVTTYHPIHAEWILSAPEDFRVGLLQGLAESDGSPNIAAQSIELWIGPNWDLMIRFLQTFGIKAFRCRDAVSMVKSQAIRSFEVPILAPHLSTARYQKMKLLATTKRLRRDERLPDNVREQIVKLTSEGLSVPAIVERIAQTMDLLVSFEAAQRWSRKALLRIHETAKVPPKSQ